MSTRPPRSRAGARQDGAALLLVLWGGLLVSAMALGVSLTAGGQLATSTGMAERLRAEALADAGVRAGISTMLQRGPLGSHSLPRVFAFKLDAGEVSVSVAPEHGRVDVNFAPEDVVRSLANVVTDGDGESLADAWLARRAASPTSDAESDDEPEFATEMMMVKQELLGFPQVTGPVYERLAVATTLHSRRPGIDPLSAPRDVLLSLPGATPEVIDTFLAERDALVAGDGFADLLALAATLRARLPAAARLLVTRRPSVFGIRAVARLPGGARATRQAVVSLRRSPGQPFTVHEWLGEAAVPVALSDAARAGRP